jgi:hypothetical protein
MLSSLRGVWVISLVGSLLTLAPAQASAQNQAENVAAARALGIQGVQLAEEGKCSEAIPPLERAEALYHAPSILGRLGECQVAVGQLVLGTENLHRTVREPLGPNAPQAFRDAQARARKVLDSTLPRIARLVIHVQPADAEVKVTVDEAEVPRALIGAERPTDPGTHELRATAAGFLEARISVTLAEASREEVTLTLMPGPNAASQTAAPPDSVPVAPGWDPPVAPAPRSVESGARSSTAGWLLLGVGAAGLVTGGVTGFVAIKRTNDLECPNKRCPEAQHDELEAAESMALVSTVAFGVGIAGALAGTITLVAQGSRNESAAKTARVSVRARPFLRGRSIGIEGSF